MQDSSPDYITGAGMDRSASVPTGNRPNQSRFLSRPALDYPPNAVCFANGLLPSNPGPNYQPTDTQRRETYTALRRGSITNPHPPPRAMSPGFGAPLVQFPNRIQTPMRTPSPEDIPLERTVTHCPYDANNNPANNSNSNRNDDTGRSMFMTVECDEVVTPPSFWKRHKQVIIALCAGSLIFAVVTAVVIFILTFTKEGDGYYPSGDEIDKATQAQNGNAGHGH